MSNENGSPYEFLDVEARLSALAPSPSRVDRDTLLYRAGFAAAKAQAARRRWVRPVTTAASVLVAVVVTHAVSSTSGPAVVPGAGETPNFASHPAEEPDVVSPSAKAAEEETPWHPKRPHPQYRFNPETAPLLAARERALAMDFDERPELASDSPPRPRPRATIRQLQKELFPHRTNAPSAEEESPRHWLRRWLRNGEST